MKGTHANTTATSLLVLCMSAVCTLQPLDCRNQQDCSEQPGVCSAEPEPPLSFPRCWAHCQPCEVRGALPGADAGRFGGTDCALCALCPSAAGSLRPGLSAVQILQAPQARGHTAQPAQPEPNLLLLTSRVTAPSRRVAWFL